MTGRLILGPRGRLTRPVSEERRAANELPAQPTSLTQLSADTHADLFCVTSPNFNKALSFFVFRSSPAQSMFVTKGEISSMKYDEGISNGVKFV